MTTSAPGFACFVGRPNAGKSTLTNALVGQKVAITSGRPQTTRHTVRGIVHRHDAQLVLVDTPGLHRPRTLLGERLNALVKDTLTEVDVVGLLPAGRPEGRAGRPVHRRAARRSWRGDGRGTPVVAVVTKADLVRQGQARRAPHGRAGAGGVGRHRARLRDVGYQVDVLADVLIGHLPEGPPLYADGELTDEPEVVMVAELVREAALEGVRDELPHSLAVVVDEIVARDEPAANGRADARRARATCSSSGTARRRSSSARAARGCATSAARRGAASRRCSARACTSTCT